MGITLCRNNKKKPSTSYKLASRIQLGRKVVFLPNERVPLVIQNLTQAQIDAIPKNKYVVEVIEPVEPTGHFMFNCEKVSPSKRILRHLLSKKRDYPDDSGSTLPRMVRRRSSQEQEFITAISFTKQLGEYIEKQYYKIRELNREQGDTPPSDSDIFNPAIDEGELSDCILKVINSYYGEDGNDKAIISGGKYKIGEFCLLMFYYFIRVKIITKPSQQPFCDYLENMVFMNERQFTAKTFNNYARAANYAKEKDRFTSDKEFNIDFSVPPYTGGTLLSAFHEIGHAFHTSEYIKLLRELRDDLNECKF